MKILRQTYLISAPVSKVWQALVDPKIIDKWGGGPAKMRDEVGYKFSLWGRDIHGTNTKVIKERELAQDWYGGDWEKPSKLIFTLSSKDGKTQVALLHEDVPDEEAEDINDGWRQYYLGPIKELLESE